MESLREREILNWLHERISAADWRLLGTNLGLSGVENRRGEPTVDGRA